MTQLCGHSTEWIGKASNSRDPVRDTAEEKKGERA